MKNAILDVIVIGGGHAGVSLSYHLKNAGLNHLVLERGVVGESWRSQRWHSFRMNTVNRLNRLPAQIDDKDPEQFSLASEYADGLKSYVLDHGLPVVEEVLVTSVTRDNKSGLFRIQAEAPGRNLSYFSRQVVIASGTQNEKKFPVVAGTASREVLQLHASDYKEPASLPDGAVLVVGSAQSGCQIAEDLATTGRKVYLSTSKVARIPRQYRGKDILDWLISTGFFDMRTEDVTDPKIFNSVAPQLTGTTGKTISLQSLAASGVILLGRLEQISGDAICFANNASAHVQFADETSAKMKGMIDEFIAKTGLTAGEAEIDPADQPDPAANCVPGITELNCKTDGICTIIWCTGFTKNLDFLRSILPVEDGSPLHRNGISAIPGLYFAGQPWLRKRKSGVLYGINEDSEYIAEQVYRYFKEQAKYEPMVQGQVDRSSI